MTASAEFMFDAAILDLDGVVTRTADLHVRAWKRVFDEFLRERGAGKGDAFREFDPVGDYLKHVDGQKREDGIRSFMKSRGIPISEQEVLLLSQQKNDAFRELLSKEGPGVFQDAVRKLQDWRRRGIKTAVVSSSRNCGIILEAAGLDRLFDLQLDGTALDRLGIPGKPAPDLFLAAARGLDVLPQRALVVEDSQAGVQAARHAGFGKVIGLARERDGADLLASGADLVIRSLDDLSLTDSGRELRTVWTLSYYSYKPKDEKLRETLCCLGNGYFATRGAAEEGGDRSFHYAGTYLAGGYNRLVSSLAGKEVEHEDLVNWPNWLPLSFRASGGTWFSLEDFEVLEFRQNLKMDSGVLERQLRVRDPQGRVTRLESQRFVSMADPHLAAIRWGLVPENWEGGIELRSGLDGNVRNEGVLRYEKLNQKHLELVEARSFACPEGEGVSLLVQANQSRIRLAEASLTQVRAGEKRAPRKELVREGSYVGELFELECRSGEAIRVEKLVTLYSSKDPAISEPLLAAETAVRRAGGYEKRLGRHEFKMRQMWATNDIELIRSPFEQLAVRLHVFHVLQTISVNSLDSDLGIPARGLHGEAYRGHVFWDDLFVFPFFNYRMPEVSRHLLKYRFRRLGEARHLAREAGHGGALFPWQSGSSGREESPKIHLNPLSGRWVPDYTHRQAHVDSAVAYNIWQYFQITQDREFLSHYGAEMLLEIARFWARRATFSQRKGKYELLNVVGPDEFHAACPHCLDPGIHNNAYTNVMASWAIAKALKVFQILDRQRASDLRAELHLQPDELSHWDDVSRNLFVPFLPNGIIEQFEGFDQLPELDFEAYRKKYGNIHRLDRILEAEGTSTHEFKIVKQADVLMLFYLFSSEELIETFSRLGYALDPEVIPRTISYYMKYTAHGSTLSRAIHSWVLSRSDRQGSWALLQSALESDLSDSQGGTTPEGIHLGAMGETIDLLQRCYTGMEPRDEVLWFNPRLPDELPGIRYRVRYRGHWLSILIDHDKMRVAVDRSWLAPARIGFRGSVYTLHEGDYREFALTSETSRERSAA